MASRYWIGGSGNWSDTAHWSTASGGSGGASAPSTSDTAYIDTSSGNGTLTLNTNISVIGIDIAVSSTVVFDSAGYSVTCSGTFKTGSSSNSPYDILLRSSVLTIGGNFDISSTSTKIDYGTSEIHLTGSSSQWRTTTTNGQAYKVFVDGTHMYSVFDNTIQFLTIAGGATLKLFKARTLTIADTITFNSSSGNIITIVSDTNGTAGILSKASGIIYADYLSIKDNTVTGGATWYAGLHSTNVSGNTGWQWNTMYAIPPFRKA